MRQPVGWLCGGFGVLLLSVTVGAGQGGPPPPPAPPGAPPTAPRGGGPAPAPAAAPAPAPTPEAIERAATILAATRQALGGDRLTKLTTLIATGQTRRIRGNNLVPIEFEILIELPDKYLRRDESPAEEADPTTSGFAGDDLIQLPAPVMPMMPARAGGPPPPTPEQMAMQRRARVTTLKQDYARLALGLFAASPAGYPLTFSYFAQAEAPQGRADVLDVRGQGNFSLRLFVNSQTRQPIMVSWTLPPTGVIVTVPGQPAPPTVAPGAVVVAGPPAPAPTATQAERDAYAKEVLAVRQAAQAKPVEHRLYFADYRDVDGVQLPFRLRRAIGADTTEETVVDRYRLNARIDARRFTPVK